MKKNRLHITYTLFFLAACGTEKPQPGTRETQVVKPIDSTPVLAATDTLTERPVIIKPDKKWSFQQKADSFIVAYQLNYTEEKSDKRTVLMRFENTWMKQISLLKKFTVPYGDTVVSPRAEVSFYQYADSSQRANAMSNWLACFGSDCNQIVQGEDVQIKSTPGFYIINEKEIITLDYPLEHEKNNWGEMKKNLRLLFATPASILVEVAPHGRVKWLK